MTHDPLCRSMFHHYYEDYPCDCDICQSSCDCKRVAKIRADTLSKVREVVRQLPSTKVILDDDESWYEPAIIERGKVISAIDALRGES